MLSFIAMTIADALFQVKERIGKSAVRAGRSLDAVTLIAVSKTVGPGQVLEAVRAGATILGENRVQEAHKKIVELSGPLSGMSVRWHLIGSLQKNKAKQAVQLFDLIHSVDSAGLAAEINRAAGRAGKLQKILIQVKLADEQTKHGVSEEGLMELLKEVALMDNLSFEGIMTMPPYFDDPEQTRPYFRQLRQIAEHAGAEGFAVRQLSMGMSHDFETAIEEGATMVRVGTAIFGERPRHRAHKRDHEGIAGL